MKQISVQPEAVVPASGGLRVYARLVGPEDSWVKFISFLVPITVIALEDLDRLRDDLNTLTSEQVDESGLW